MLWLAGTWLGKLIAVIWLAVKAWGALNLIMTMNPIGLVIVGITALVAGLRWAYDNVDSFRHALIRLWEVGKSVFGGLGKAWDAFTRGDWSGVMAAFSDAWKRGQANANATIALDNTARAAKRAGATAGAKPGANPTGVGKPNASGGTKPGSVGQAAGLSGTTGGTKATSITINLKNLVEHLTINASGVREGADEMQRELIDRLTRTLMGAQAAAAQ